MVCGASGKDLSSAITFKPSLSKDAPISNISFFRYNGNGQLGIGSSDDLTTPKAVQGLPDDVEIEAISAGDNHVLALTSLSPLL